VGRKSISGGVTALGNHRIQFDFTIAGVRYRPTLPWIPHEANLRRARDLLTRIKACIVARTFIVTEYFPRYRGRETLRLPFSTRTCGDLFDAFLLHEEARVQRGDLAPITLTAHRQILDHVWRPAIGTLSLLAVRYSTLVKVADEHNWTKKTYNNVISALRRAFEFGFQNHPEHHNPANSLKSARIYRKDRPKIDPFSIQDEETFIVAIHRDWDEAQGNYDEFRFFTGLRPSEQIALVVTDHDATNGVLSITKARVSGIDRDRTKIAEDRRVVLNARARAVLERQLRLRAKLKRSGRIQHEHLFFHADGEPIRRLHKVHYQWRHTLKRLAIRYRRPYTARHSSVSWNLMLGGNPLYVAQQRASYPHDAHHLCGVDRGQFGTDVVAIRRAMNAPAFAARRDSSAGARFGNKNAAAIARLRRQKQNETPPQTTVDMGHSQSDLAVDLPIENVGIGEIPKITKTWIGGADGTRTRDLA